MQSNFFSLIKENQSIPGIKDDDDLRAVLQLDSRIVFVLYGNLLTIQTIVRKLKEHGKYVLINVDLIEGFSSKEIVVKFLKQNTQIDGILSSKGQMIKAARSLGLFAIHRFFLIDSFSYSNLSKQAEISKPDCIEIMPGCMPRVISWIVNEVSIPVIAGGLVCDLEDAGAALKAGAKAISSTNRTVWSLKLDSRTVSQPIRKTERVILKDLTKPS